MEKGMYYRYIGLALLTLSTPVLGDTFDTPYAACEASWDTEALWVSCSYSPPNIDAPDGEPIWERTSVEVFAGGPDKPWKFFCDLEGNTQQPPDDRVYPDNQGICTSNGSDVIEAGIKWSGLGISPIVGQAVPFALNVNTHFTNPNWFDAWRSISGPVNNSSAFGTFVLTKENFRNTEAGSPPQGITIDDTNLVITWDPQDTAEWFWIYVNRDGIDLPRVKAETNEYPLDPFVIEGSSEYIFEVSAEAEGLEESGRSVPLHTWILLSGTPRECPTCPTCPPAVEASPVCPEELPPTIQEILVTCVGD